MDKERIMIMRRISLFIILLLLFSDHFFAKDLAEILPEKSSGMIEMNSPKKLWNHFVQNKILPGPCREELKQSWKKLWKGAWAKQLKDKFGMQPLDLVFKYPDKVSISFGNIVPLFGEYCFNKKFDQDALEIGLFLSSSDKDKFTNQVTSYIEKAVQFQKENKKISLQQKKHRDIPFKLVGLDYEDWAINKLYLAWIDNWLIVTPSLPYLKKIIDVSKGAPSLKSDEDYRKSYLSLDTTQSELSGLYNRKYCVDIKELKKLAEQADSMNLQNDQERVLTQNALNFFEFFFREIQNIAFTFGFMERSITTEIFILCDPEAPKGPLHIIGRKENLDFPPWIWPDISSRFIMALDNEFFKEFLANYFGSESMDLLNKKLTLLTSLDLEKDLLDSIGDQIVMLEKFNGKDKQPSNPQSGGLWESSENMIISIALSREEPWHTLFQKLSMLFKDTLTQTDYLETRIYSIGAGSTPDAQTQCGVVKNRLLYGTQRLIEKAVRRLNREPQPAPEKNRELEEALALIGQPNALLVQESRKIIHHKKLTGIRELQNKLCNILKNRNDPLSIAVGEMIETVANSLLDPENWKNTKLNLFGAASWESNGFRYKELDILGSIN